MTRPSPPLRPGRALAPGYRVLAHLSRSDVIDVYDVWSEERDCRCVAKGLRPDCADDARARRMLVREGHLLRRLTHPHIVRGYDVLRTPAPVVVVETLTGATLEHAIYHGARRRLALDELAVLGLHLCSAIDYLHRHTGVLHLDLKPSNVIAEHGRAKVIDLSVARRPGAGHRGVGTPRYLSPERARGDAVTAATDVWGIGAVLYEAATRRAPFANPVGDVYDQLERRADSARRHRDLPLPFTAAVDRCLDPRPERRPTVSALARTLRRLVPALS